MKFEFIDTPSHGYLKVHKNYFVSCGFDVTNVSKYSGQDKNYVYLEEDCDAGKFVNFVKDQGTEVEFKETHRNRNNVPSHNYDPAVVNPNHPYWL